MLYYVLMFTVIYTGRLTQNVCIFCLKMGDGSQRATSALSSRDMCRPRDVEEEELRMLASLCREEEDNDQDDGSIGSGGGGGSTLSASQRRRCNVSLSISSDDTTTWTQCYPVVSRHVTRGWRLL